MATYQNAQGEVIARPDPHGVGWFTRLLRWARLQSHPISAGVSDPDDFDSADARGMHDWMERQLRLTPVRTEQYRIFEEMDQFDMVSSVLDAYAEESTQPDYERKRTVWVESKSRRMVEAGDVCLQNIQAEDRAFAIARRTCQFGNEFRRLIYQTGKGVLGWKYAHPAHCHRVEDKFDRLVGFKQDGQKFRAKDYPVSWPWDYTHFRLLGKDDWTTYGTSLMVGWFRAWRQEVLAEDAVLGYRMQRAPDRNLVFIDVGEMDEAEAMQAVNAWRKKFRKNEYLDPASPSYRKSYNPISPREDIFWPIRGSENNSRVETLSGAGNMDQLFDLDYMRKKFFGAARAPAGYFGWSDDLNAKSTLMQLDVRWARMLKRVQKSQIYGYRNTLEIHYELLAQSGKDDYAVEANPFVVQMSPISYLDELERLELMQTRVAVMEQLSQLGQTLQVDPRVWATYILITYAKLDEDLVLKLVSKAPTEPAAVAAAGPAGGFPPAGGVEPVAPLTPDDEEPGAPEGHVRRNTAAALVERRARELEQRMRLPKGSLTEPVGRAGYTELSEQEQREIARLMHNSPQLRRLVGNIAYLHEDDMEDIQRRQTDPSRCPPRVVQGQDVIVLEDCYDDDGEAKKLNEHMESLARRE
jgi:hypothetical protein